MAGPDIAGNGRVIDPEKWERAAQFKLFSSYERPHFCITARLDVTRLTKAAASDGVSAFRGFVWAAGCGVDGVAELKTRLSGDRVIAFENVLLSAVVPRDGGGLGYTYMSHHPDYKAFDKAAAAEIKAAARGTGKPANTGETLDVVYLSCLPWLDFTAISHTMSGRGDSIPRISWGRFSARHDGGTDVAVAMEVHHALADGEHVAKFFALAQQALDRF